MNPNYPGGGGGYGGPPGGGPPGGYGPPGGGGPPGGYGGPPGGGGYGGPPGGYGGPPPGGFGGPPGGYGGPPGGAPGGFGGPPGFGMGGMPGGAPPDELKKKVDLWFILSCISIFCGCGLLGIINIIYANGAKQALAAGDYATAQSKIGTAKTLCIVGYCLLGVSILLNIIAAAAH